MSGGVFGPTDKVTDATKQAMTTNGAGWAGVITGTDATIVCHRSAGDQTNQILVSVDGQPFAAPAYSGAGGIFPLFSGLSQGTHFVVVKPGAAYSNQVYFPTSGNIISVTGVSPAIDVVSGARIQPLDGNALACSSGFPATAIGGNFTPSPGPANQSTSQTAAAGSSVPVVRFRSAANELQIVNSSQYVFVSVNGGMYTMYNTMVAGSVGARLLRLTGLGGVAATYTIWPSWEQSAGGGYGAFSVSSDAALVDCGTKRRIDAFGDSIDFGAGTTAPTLDGGSGTVDIFIVAAALNLTPCTFGISGNTTNQLAQRFGWNAAGTVQTGTGFLASVSSGTGDVAVLATGRNDAVNNTAMTAQQIIDYTNCVTALVAKYGKVICRGVIPTTGQNWNAYNAGILAIVTAQANSNITYVDPTGWVFTTVDGTHPDRPGYITIAGLEQAAYAAAI